MRKYGDENSLIYFVLIIIYYVVRNLHKRIEKTRFIKRLNDSRENERVGNGIIAEVIKRFGREFDFTREHVGGYLRPAECRGHEQASFDFVISVFRKISHRHDSAHARADYLYLFVPRRLNRPVYRIVNLVGNGKRVESPVIMNVVNVLCGHCLYKRMGQAVFEVIFVIKERIIFRALGIFDHSRIIKRVAVFVH